MFIVLLLLLLSIGAGYLMRRNDGLKKLLGQSTTVTILLLLLIFGMSIGSNESILSNLHKDGVKAVTIALLGVAGSVAASVCFKLFNRKKGGKA